MSARQSPEVYRRRRLVVFGGMLLVILLIGWGIWALATQLGERDDGKTPQPGDSQQPQNPDDPENPDATGTDPQVGSCTESNIVVAPLTDATTYSAGEMPRMQIELTNTGLSDCTMNVGTSTQVFTVTSGQDVWWRSTDCQVEPSDMVVTLKAGETVTNAEPVVWNRTRSSPNTCQSENRPLAPGGGASYHVSVEIGGFSSESTKQIMLF